VLEGATRSFKLAKNVAEILACPKTRGKNTENLFFNVFEHPEYESEVGLVK
jgi:uncharacterized protein YbaR (Trm112 family)